MRSYSKVSPRIWTGRLGKAMRGDALLQALATYLVSNQHLNMAGLYLMPIAYVAFDMGHQEDGIRAAMAKLEALEYCFYDHQTARVWVVEYWRHELDSKPLRPGDKRLVGLYSILNDHRCSSLTRQMADYYGLEWNEETVEGATQGAIEGASQGPPKGSGSQAQAQAQSTSTEHKQVALERGAEPSAPVFDWETEIPIPKGLNVPAFRSALRAWLEYRSERHLGVWKSRTIALKLKQLDEWGPTRAVAAIENSIRECWQGIFEPKENGSSPGRTRASGSTIPATSAPGEDERLRKAGRRTGATKP